MQAFFNFFSTRQSLCQSLCPHYICGDDEKGRGVVVFFHYKKDPTPVAKRRGD
jgi:hypothetical protein